MDGSPLSGVTVTVGEQSALTTPEGRYELSVTYGEYFVVASKETYVKYKSAEKVKVPPDGVASQDIVMKIDDDTPPEVLELNPDKTGLDWALIVFTTDENAKATLD